MTVANPVVGRPLLLCVVVGRPLLLCVTLVLGVARRVVGQADGLRVRVTETVRERERVHVTDLVCDFERMAEVVGIGIP